MIRAMGRRRGNPTYPTRRSEWLKKEILGDAPEAAKCRLLWSGSRCPRNRRAINTQLHCSRDQSGVPSHLHEIWTIKSHTGYRQMNFWLLTEHERDPDLPFWLMTLSDNVHQPRDTARLVR